MSSSGTSRTNSSNSMWQSSVLHCIRAHRHQTGTGRLPGMFVLWLCTSEPRVRFSPTRRTAHWPSAHDQSQTCTVCACTLPMMQWPRWKVLLACVESTRTLLACNAWLARVCFRRFRRLAAAHNTLLHGSVCLGRLSSPGMAQQASACTLKRTTWCGAAALHLACPTTMATFLA